MFGAIRILPLFVVLGAAAVVAKSSGLLMSVSEPDLPQVASTAQAVPEARLAAELASLQSIADAPLRSDPAILVAEGGPEAMPREVAPAALKLPQSPEEMLAPAAGDAAADQGEDAADADGESAALETAASAEGGEAGLQNPSQPVRDPFDMSDEELELLQRLVERRNELAERSRTLDQREALLEATEARIADKMNELKSLQAAIEALLVQYDDEEEARLQSLVKIYESMKPKEAARIFEELDILVLLDVIGRMKERKSAPILAKMNPLKAKTVTLELAQRRAMPFARE